jgi:hypothetical protein
MLKSFLLRLHGTTFAKTTHRPLSALLDKGRIFPNILTPSNLQRTSTLLVHLQQLHKEYSRGAMMRDTISVSFAMTYILQDNLTIQELFRLIIDVNDREDDKREVLAMQSLGFT